MKDYSIMSSGSLSGLFYIGRANEPGLELVYEASRRGLFIGCSEVYSMPFFLDFEFLMNRHVFVFGMSGGGKTFLMRSLVLKLHAVLDSLAVLLDFTGEYKKFVELAGETDVGIDSIEEVLRRKETGILYLNLSGIGEEVRVRIAEGVLARLVRLMRSRKTDAMGHVYVILDEAWKLLGGSGRLETIIREGRKYGLGLVLASQLIEDVDLAILSNVATIFIFRSQDKESLERLSKNYNLTQDELLRIQNLEVGSCFVIQTYKAGKRGAFVIRKVLGVEMEVFYRVVFGENMLEINDEELEAMIRRACSKDPSALIASISSDGHIELYKLIKGMMQLGADRRRILASLRDAGIDDYEIADAFAFAIEDISEAHEE